MTALIGFAIGVLVGIAITLAGIFVGQVMKSEDDH